MGQRPLRGSPNSLGSSPGGQKNRGRLFVLLQRPIRRHPNATIRQIQSGTRPPPVMSSRLRGRPETEGFRRRRRFMSWIVDGKHRSPSLAGDRHGFPHRALSLPVRANKLPSATAAKSDVPNQVVPGPPLPRQWRRIGPRRAYLAVYPRCLGCRRFRGPDGNAATALLRRLLPVPTQLPPGSVFIVSPCRLNAAHPDAGS